MFAGFKRKLVYPRWARDARRGTAIREMSTRKVSFALVRYVCVFFMYLVDPAGIGIGIDIRRIYFRMAY